MKIIFKIAKYMLCAVCVAGAVSSTTASAASFACSQGDAKAAEAVASTAKSWKQLYEQYKRYSRCDDGAIAEGFSEATTHLLADNWQDISRLANTLKLDSPFRIFVIRHVNESVPLERLNRIAENADTKCFPNLKNFCSEIKSAVEHSLGH